MVFLLENCNVIKTLFLYEVKFKFINETFSTILNTAQTL